MKLFRALAFTFGLSALPLTAVACGFTEVIAGACSTNETVLDGAGNGHVDKGVLRRQLIWTLFDEFRRDPASDITLKVCGFLSTPTGSGIATIDFRGNQQRFANNMRIVETAAQEWVVDSQKDKIESRLKFAVRGANGGYSVCPADGGGFHIKIAFNQNGRNDSAIGFRSATKVPSMNLNVIGSNQVVNHGTAVHEFGHALGLGHEMMHPLRAPCMRKFDAGRWLADFQETNGRLPFGETYSRERQIEIAQANIQKVIRNMEGLDLTALKDDGSIMSYPITADSFSDDGAACSMRRNGNLSRADRAIALTNYGRLLP